MANSFISFEYEEPDDLFIFLTSFLNNDNVMCPKFSKNQFPDSSESILYCFDFATKAPMVFCFLIFFLQRFFIINFFFFNFS